jgi:hypothetical protein
MLFVRRVDCVSVSNPESLSKLISERYNIILTPDAMELYKKLGRKDEEIINAKGRSKLNLVRGGI